MRTPAAGAPELERWKLLLDADERERSDRYKLSADRASYIAAHSLLRSTMSAITHLEPDTWKLNAEPGGKPLFDPPSGLAFSLSHCRRFVACAISRNFEVGIDIEDMTRPEEQWRNAEDFLPPGERELLNVSDRSKRRERFFRLWTLREAFAKASGTGLAYALEHATFELDPVRLRETQPSGACRWQFITLTPTCESCLALAVKAVGDRFPNITVTEARLPSPDAENSEVA